MRPVKASLKQLGIASQNPDEQVEQTRQCVLKIGDHINSLLAEMNDLDKIKESRK